MPGGAITADMKLSPSCRGGKRRRMPSRGHSTAALFMAGPLHLAARSRMVETTARGAERSAGALCGRRAPMQ